MPPHRREVYWFDFGDSVGSEPDKVRSCVVIQTPFVRGLNTVIVVPCTEELRRAKQPTGVSITAAETGTKDLVALCHLVCARDISRIAEDRTGMVTEVTMQRILAVLCDLLGIDADLLYARDDDDR